MSRLLARLSANFAERREETFSPKHSPSFSDFSLHVHQEVDETHASTSKGPQSVTIPHQEPRPSPFQATDTPMSTSAPSPGLTLPAKTPALKIPRTSVAAQLMSQSSGLLGTPRRSTDPASAASPRTPLAGADPDVPRSPRSPHSPLTPGGQRRRSQKINGMDYYEFCELIRASSL